MPGIVQRMCDQLGEGCGGFGTHASFAVCGGVDILVGFLD